MTELREQGGGFTLDCAGGQGAEGVETAACVVDVCDVALQCVSEQSAAW
jgi:hypothetical protein